MRIGVSVAKGLASAQKLPLIGVSTLDVLVAAYAQDARPLYALYAAGRRRVGYARYRWQSNGWQAETGVNVVDWTELARAAGCASGCPWRAERPGLEALRHLYGRIEIPSPAHHLRRAGFWQTLPGFVCGLTR